LYFFTVVTYRRRPLLARPDVRRALRAAWHATCAERPFTTVALVLLPSHLHCVWRLPEGDAEFGTRWRLIKTRTTRALAVAGWQGQAPSPSRARTQEATIWQRRFWEHQIRDDEDLRQHVDYVHYNPGNSGDTHLEFR
jgi:putative transposase